MGYRVCSPSERCRICDVRRHGDCLHTVVDELCCGSSNARVVSAEHDDAGAPAAYPPRCSQSKASTASRHQRNRV